MAEVVAPSVRMGGKKMWIVKPEAGHRIVVRRKSPVRKNRISRKIAAAGSRVVPARRMRGSRSGGNERMRPGHGRHRSAAMLLSLPDERNCANKKEKED